MGRIVRYSPARSAQQQVQPDPVSAEVPNILCPWPAKPTFTTAALTATPQRLDMFRSLTEGAWYATANDSAEGTGDLFLIDAATVPAASHPQRVRVPRGQVAYVRHNASEPTWVWGAGVVMDVAPAAWNRAIYVLSNAVPQKSLTSGRDDVDALGMVAAARVEREAAGAPQAIRNEAVIRYAAYLGQSIAAEAGAVRKRTTGPYDTEFIVNHANAWRHCGAAGLLAPWKVRRAGVIG